MAWGFGVGGVLTALSTQVLGWVNTTMTYFGNASLSLEVCLRSQPDVSWDRLCGRLGSFSDDVCRQFVGQLWDHAFSCVLCAYGRRFATVWNAEAAVNALGVDALAGAYSKYIGAGMMLCGGLIGALKLLPVIKTSLQQTLHAKDASQKDTLGLIGLAIASVGIFGIGLIVADSLWLALLAGFLSLFWRYCLSLSAHAWLGPSAVPMRQCLG
jgi:hypothetical protein